MVRQGYELSPEMVGWAIAGLQRLRPDELGPSLLGPEVPMSMAVQLGRNGRPKKGEENSYNVRVTSFGNSAAYTLARLNRDRPDLAARVRAKEIKLLRLVE